VKWDLCDQDKEDYEQELRIQQWLDQTGNQNRIDLKHINREGNARNTLVRASFSLDQEIKEDSTGTFADFIAGDPTGGSSLGGSLGHDSRDAAAALDAYLACLGFNEEDTEWLIEKLKSLEKMKLKPSLKFQSDLEWSLPLPNCDP